MDIKILFYQHIEVIGGAETYLLRLLPELKRRGISVGFYCAQIKSNKEIVDLFSSKLSAENIPVIVCKTSSPFSLKNTEMLSKSVSRGKYSILSIHLIHAEVSTVLSKILFGIKCKIVVTKHGYQQVFNGKYGLDFSKLNRLSLRYLTERMIQPFITHNIAVSQGMAEFYTRSAIVKKNKIMVIHHGVDTTFCDNANPLRFHRNQIVMVGRLVKFKGHHYLLEAVKELKEKFTDFKVIIVGKGDEQQNLENLVSLYAIKDWVSFIGFSNKVNDYFSGSDIVIVPSIAEAFGLVILEAYCCKKPVIAFNVPALNEIVINNETGFLIDSFNTKEMANKILDLIQNKQKAITFGQNGYNLIRQKFTYETTVDKTVEYYQQV